jgi:hypothetical protein
MSNSVAHPKGSIKFEEDPENKMLRRLFRHNREEVTGGYKNCIMGNFIIYRPTLHRMSLK